MKKVRVGVIGTGAIAQVAHFPVLASLPEVELAAVYSRTYEHALASAQRYGAEKACRTFGEFLDAGLDCAVLLTPKTVRAEYLPALLENGLDVLCEKPLATTLSECGSLADAAEKSGRILMVAFNRRFALANAKALEAFGGRRPHMVIANKSREYKEYRGTLENAIHMVDFLRYALGECVEVSARSIFTDPLMEDACSALLGFEGGGIGLLAASRESGQWREQIEMYGGGVTAVSDNLDACRVIYPDREEAFHFTPLNKGWCTVVNRLGFEGCIKHFIHCVRTRETPVTNAQDAYKTHELMDRILRAAGLPDLSGK
ncbi:MAG TPA: Gfo/Idh/MocA family oxidoreductase [Candidatus Limnocylindria bacterium]|nr:Gfo/Idh/MocA family oxidoreductase [Candidatus Limnocylindria bacterium]